MAQNNAYSTTELSFRLGSNQRQTLTCPSPACESRFSRQQELNRHFQSFHLPRWIFCPHSGCKWRGGRMEDFDAHLVTQKCGTKPEKQHYQIYEVKVVLDMIKGPQGGSFILTAQEFAVDFVKERALELGKQEWLDDPWGYIPERQARRERRAGSRQ